MSARGAVARVAWFAVTFTFAIAIAGLGAGAGVARAQEPPPLWQPAEAVAFLLPPARDQPARAADSRPAWDGSLGGGVIRFLFGTYRTVLSSQDLALCGFSPSCSRFSQRAVDGCGFFEGVLLSIDRLIRDHPMAVGFYPVEAGTRLLLDEPDRYCLTARR